jgi:phosphoribosylformylglycinamidine synthase
MQAGLVPAAPDPSEGGLAVALAELAIAGRVGVDVALADGTGEASPGMVLEPAELLFSESNGRLVVQVAAGAEGAFEDAMAGAPLARIGGVVDHGTPGLRVTVGAAVVVDVPLDTLVSAVTGSPAHPGAASEGRAS